MRRCLTIALLLLCAFYANVGFAQLVGTNFCTSSARNSNPSCALPSPITAGNKLVVIVIESDISAPLYSVTDTSSNTFASPASSGGPQWTIGFNGAQCGAGADGRNWCFNEIYVAPITTGGSDTITYASAGNTPDVYWMYVGEYSGIGSFDVVGSVCGGGVLFPCNGGSGSGAQSASVTTSTTSSFLFMVAACDVNTSIIPAGCSGFPTNSTGTFRANLSAGGGCCGNEMRATIFDDPGGAPGTYTETADFGATATNFVVTIWSFGFSVPTRGNVRSQWY